VGGAICWVVSMCAGNSRDDARPRGV